MATGVGAWSTLAATNATASSNINWAEGQAPSTANDSARGMMKEVADWLRDGSWVQYQDQSHTYVSAVSTKVEGRDLTAYYQANRRVRFVVGTNITYGRIAGSAFSTDTTITYALDNAGSLSATAYAVSVALADANANPIGPSPRVAGSLQYFESSLSSTAMPLPAVGKTLLGLGGLVDGMPYYESSLSATVIAAQRLKVMANAIGFATGKVIQFNSSLSATFASVSSGISSKVISFTRDMTAASGSVAYTGVGFQPTALLMMGCITSGANSPTWAFFDSSRDANSLGQRGSDAGGYGVSATSLQIYGDTTNYQFATLDSYDADGFTLGWTKASSPTGTATIRVLCFR